MVLWETSSPSSTIPLMHFVRDCDCGQGNVPCLRIMMDSFTCDGGQWPMGHVGRELLCNDDYGRKKRKATDIKEPSPLIGQRLDYIIACGSLHLVS